MYWLQHTRWLNEPILHQFINIGTFWLGTFWPTGTFCFKKGTFWLGTLWLWDVSTTGRFDNGTFWLDTLGTHYPYGFTGAQNKRCREHGPSTWAKIASQIPVTSRKMTWIELPVMTSVDYNKTEFIYRAYLTIITGTVHTSAKACLTSVHIWISDLYRHQNLITCSLVHWQPSLKVFHANQLGSFCAKLLTNRQTNRQTMTKT